MKILVLSDLHLEFNDIDWTELPCEVDVCVLAGDILLAEPLHHVREVGDNKILHDRFHAFAKGISAWYDNVIAIAGNHEFYHFRWKETHKVLKEFYSQYGIHYLNKEYIDIGGERFFGATTWTNMNQFDPLTLHAIADMMNDFRVIRDDSRGFSPLRPAIVAQEHLETMRLLELFKPTVVISHHAPCSMSIGPEYKGEYLMNGGYYSDLSHHVQDSDIKLWCHGHMHHFNDYMFYNTRVVSAPRGYYDIKYQGKVIEI